MNYWMVKQEPEAYSFDDLIKDKTTDWTGVRNFQARINLRNMRKGDKVLFYHSVTEKAVVGLAEVSKEEYPDPTDDTGKWICVEIKAVEKLKSPVSLENIKGEPSLANISLVRQGRLSVMPLEKKEFDKILKMAG